MCDLSLEDRLLNAISDLEAEGNECEAAAVRELWSSAEGYLRALLRVSAKHLPSCPAQVLDGVKVVEGDYCRDCPCSPEKVEYTGKDCWAVWQAKVRGDDAATEEASNGHADA
jgi:hypothetical protein